MKTFIITDFGAKPDGTICTKAVQKALDACLEAGGTVIIPSGTFVTGTLEMHSDTTLYLSAGAVLKGSSHMEDYPGYGYIHNEMGAVRCLLHADECHNICIAGEGQFDFNGDAFFNYERAMPSDLDVNNLSETQKQEFVVYYEERPNQMLFFRKCTNVRIKDVMLINAACWGLVLSVCKMVKIEGITIRFGIRLPNDDGIHLVSCQNVIVSGCDIVSGDDCIAVSGIDGWMEESRNIIISNCLLSSSSAAIRFGYWNSKVKNCQVHNCTVYDSNRAVCIMSCKGGYVEDIQISGLNVETRSRAGGWWGMGEAVYIVGLSHDVHTVETDHGEYETAKRKVNIRNITIRDLNAECENGIIMVGDDYNIQDIRFYNTTVKIKDSTNRDYFGNRLELAPGESVVMLEQGEVCWLYAEDAQDILMEDVKVENRMLTNAMEITKVIKNCRNFQISSRN